MTHAVQLGDIIQLRKGKKASEVHDQRVNGAKPYIQIDEVRGAAPQKFAHDAKGVIVTPDDLCIVWDGANAGTVGYGVNGLIGSTVARMRIKASDEWDTEFVGRLLQSRFRQLNDEAQARGATIPHVDKSKLEAIELPRIARPEQQRIASILEKADRIQRKRERMIDLLDYFLLSTFKETFGDPFGNPHKLPETSVEQLCAIITDCLHTTPKHFDEPNSFPSIRSSELQNGHIDLSSAKYVSEEEYQIRIQRCKPLPGDVIYCREGARFGSVGRIPPGMTPCLGQRTMLLRADERVCTPEYLWSVLRSDFILDQAKRAVGGAASPHVNIRDIRKFACVLPPLDVQKKFSDVCQNVLRQRDRLIEDLKQASDLFAVLSQRAFRGDL